MRHTFAKLKRSSSSRSNNSSSSSRWRELCSRSVPVHSMSPVHFALMKDESDGSLLQGRDAPAANASELLVQELPEGVRSACVATGPN